jgi:hypothetical protein
VKRLRLLILAALTAAPLRAAFQDPLWSARVAGLGGAYASVSDDATGVFYNPAAFTVIKRPQVNFGYAKLLTGLDDVDLSLSAMAAVYPLPDNRALGVGWGHFSSAGLESEDTAVLSYSHRFPSLFSGDEKGFSAAVSARYLSIAFQLDPRSASDPVFSKGRRHGAVAVDLHFLTEAPDQWIPGVSVGLSLKSLNEPNVGFLTREKLPREAVLGARYQRGIFSFPLDLVAKSGGSLKPRAGVEAVLLDKRVALRAGGNADQVGTGLGYRYPLSGGTVLVIDYAFMYPLRLAQSAGSHRATVGLSF